MESTKRKRKASTSQASRKRQKPESARRPSSQRTKRPVDVGSLPWRAVEILETLDDAEGFFGLEEVEGVEVVRSGGKVQFVAAVSSADESDEFEGFDDTPPPTTHVDLPKIQDVEDIASAESMKLTSKKELAKSVKKVAKSSRADKSENREDSQLEPNLFSKLADIGTAEEGTDVSAWSQVDLSQPMLSAISRLKFSTPTPIQSAAIPEITAGRDVIGKAPTGSGKTLAFAIPIVERWLRERGTGKKAKHVPIALIISPTRELAHQITDHIKDLGVGLTEGPYVCSVTGGLSVLKQQRQLERADIVIGTPGRLWEVLSSSAPLLNSFKEIKFLVVDEADRLLKDGHFKEAEEIFNALDRAEFEEDDEGEPKVVRRQTLVFSATFNKALQQKLAGKGRYDLMDEGQSMEYLLKRLNFRETPKFLDMNPISQMAVGLKEGLVECGAMEKDLYLYSLLLLHPTHRTLVFTNSISSVRRLAPLLQNLNLPTNPLHSQMPQKARLRSIERFAASKPKPGASKTASILVATDVAARGLDIPGIDLVVHYHVPRTADAYVHRSGRTARAESSGLSVLLCGPEEVTPTRRLVAKVHATAQSRATKANASDPSGASVKKKDEERFFIRTIDLDRKLVSRLRERVTLAKRIADAALAKEKAGKDDEWLRNAAEELGVEYDDDDEAAEGGGVGSWGGRGSGRKKKEREARGLTKAEMAALRAELRQLLARRVNVGVSEKYITSGRVDVDELLKGVRGEFLGHAGGLGLDD